MALAIGRSMRNQKATPDKATNAVRINTSISNGSALACSSDNTRVILLAGSSRVQVAQKIIAIGRHQPANRSGPCSGGDQNTVAMRQAVPIARSKALARVERLPPFRTQQAMARPTRKSSSSQLVASASQGFE